MNGEQSARRAFSRDDGVLLEAGSTGQPQTVAAG
jgi:hypothetical protein